LDVEHHLGEEPRDLVRLRHIAILVRVATREVIDGGDSALVMQFAHRCQGPLGIAKLVGLAGGVALGKSPPGESRASFPIAFRDDGRDEP
jgi:hypothetical protein